MQLIGASWLIESNDRDQAIKVLDELTRDIDARIKYLAIAQLWRTRNQINAKQVEVWEGLVKNMNRSLRAAPYLVLSDAQKRSQQIDKAVISAMRVPILYPEQRALSAAALYRAANLLHNKGQAAEAQTILNELVTRYPQTTWARQSKN